MRPKYQLSTSKGRNVLARQQNIPPLTILVPIDFSTKSREALRYAATFAHRLGGSLTLLHVVKPLVSLADFGYGCVTTRSPNECLLKQSQAKLRTLGKKLRPAASKLLPLVRTGTAETEIVQAARELAADLIIIGARARAISETPVGSTVDSIVRNAPCPVLVIPRNQTQSAAREREGAQ
jgi:nucleotide-binding universal stress UspA family protein